MSEISRRQDAPVAPAAGDGQLPEVAETVWLGWNAAEPVGHSRRVVLARVVAEAGFDERVIRPRRPPVDRERRRAKRDGPPPGGLLDLVGGPLGVGAELLSRLFVHARVCITVRGRFVPAPGDLGDDVAMVRGTHPEQEERRARVQLVQQIEQPQRLRLEDGVRLVPNLEAESPVHELMPVLEVDRQQQPRLLHRGDCSYAGPRRGVLAATTWPLPASLAR